MGKIKDLSPKFSRLPTAERELVLPYVDPAVGQNIGGLSMYGKSLKRGYGNKTFGADENGIWLGAADFPDAPFSVDLDGNIIARSISFLDSATVSQAIGLNQQITALTTPTILTSSQIIVTVDRPTYLLLLADVHFWTFRTSGSGDWNAVGIINFYKDTTKLGSQVRIAGEQVSLDDVGANLGTNTSLHYLILLDPGTYTFSLKGELTSNLGNGAINIASYRFTIIDLGGSL